MLELFLAAKKKAAIPPPTIGDTKMGYYGIVSAADFATGERVAADINLNYGNAVYGDAGWLKFAYNEKILYIAKKPMRWYLSWKHIYDSGAVYGTDNEGTNVVNGMSRRIQNARVTINGDTYRVRLMRVSDSMAYSNYTIGGEYRDLFLKVLASKNGPWDSLSDVDVGFPVTDDLMRYNWAIEGQAATNAYRAVYGQMNLEQIGERGYTEREGMNGWRPVLELITD